MILVQNKGYSFDKVQSTFLARQKTANHSDRDSKDHPTIRTIETERRLDKTC